MITRMSVAALSPTGAAAPVKQAALTLSDEWSPYIQADLTLAAASPSALDEYDPRKSMPPAVVLEVARHGGDDGNSLAAWTALALAAGKVRVSSLTTLMGGKIRTLTGLSNPYDAAHQNAQRVRCVLSVDEAKYDYKTAEIQLSLMGAEQLLHDWVPNGERALAANTVAEVVSQVLRTVGLSPVVADVWATACIAPTWEAGQAPWSIIEPMLADIGLRLIHDLDGLWHIVNRDGRWALGPGDIPEVTTAQVTNLSRRLARADWADYVTVVATFSDPSGIESAVRSTAGVSPGSKPVYIDRGNNPATTFYDSAEKFINRYQGRGDSHDYSTPTDLSVQPLQIVEITGQQQIVSKVTHSFPEATTTVTTREG